LKEKLGQTPTSNHAIMYAIINSDAILPDLLRGVRRVGYIWWLGRVTIHPEQRTKDKSHQSTHSINDQSALLVMNSPSIDKFQGPYPPCQGHCVSDPNQSTTPHSSLDVDSTKRHSWIAPGPLESVIRLDTRRAHLDLQADLAILLGEVVVVGMGDFFRIFIAVGRQLLPTAGDLDIVVFDVAQDPFKIGLERPQPS